ncbi:TIGR02281 family clan AA aspartic protease [Amphritea pacifica]|uniref:TIGR02281 family clan AA aspartic protease n=1 Tax=Amphritea pacifica TaxID=2811233 RepID=A0ABS2WAX6_9GAMM|nr:TIGR02281 family clan AA aspartic protease [Amphritea pacifica]MBN0988876.1 TIGR02281 family clan AA aspartic protease [Amphritea pacifica]MBN1006912.1 TIGR02281 family clan AA aspartic protease [Amphritea pacifica]
MKQDSSRHFVGRLFAHLTWITLLGVFYLIFQGRLLQQNDPNHALQVSDNHQPVVLQRNRQGHYVAPGTINGQPVQFLLDTGATDISIPGTLADTLRLTPGRVSYASTANGTIKVYDTRLDSVALGGLSLADVSAHINPHMQGETVLLGMSFLQHLELIQRGDTLTLKR